MIENQFIMKIKILRNKYVQALTLDNYEIICHVMDIKKKRKCGNHIYALIERTQFLSINSFQIYTNKSNKSSADFL